MAKSPLEATANEPPRSTSNMELLVEAQGVDAGEELYTHARDCSAMEDTETVLEKTGLARTIWDAEEGRVWG